MDLHTAINERRTVHDWADAPVPELVVKRALEAAHSAPCHKFTWPWRFVWAGPETRQALFDLGVRLKTQGKEPNERLLGKLTAKLKNPAHLVAVTQIRVDDAFQAKEDYAACACAIQNMALSIHADGFASKWGSGGITRHEKAYEYLDVDPAKEEIIAFVWIGVPAKVPERPERSPLREHIRRTP
ncbi:MAG: nitroreductase family protein [Myxococcota bacterium]|nr:nitroreductase family protein [Myxococcota bacterium]